MGNNSWRKNDISDIKIISVESRKGGVGKTTAALNLAKLYFDNGYSVLFLDADITGTNITEALDSFFWRDITNIIQQRCDNKLRKKTQKLNLLELFQNKYMIGEDYYQDFNFSKNRINVIGSHLFKKNNNNHIICKPSVLFDDLHAFWFIEFLHIICTEFISFVCKKSKNPQKIAIIIDNSPGYIGIAPKIQEWLTDLGPVIGKFLLVSSLDEQDLSSCFKAAESLRDLFVNKFQRAQEFKKMQTSKVEFSKTPDNIDFFIRLSEQPNQTKNEYIDITGKNLDFYFSNYSKISLSSFLGFIINKVPAEIKNGVFEYNFPQPENNLEKILVGDDVDENYKRMVCYNQYIEYQFLQHRLIHKNDLRLDLEKTAKVARRLLNSYKIKNTYVNNNDENLKINFSSTLHVLEKANNTIQGMIELLNRHGLRYLTKLINPQWLPESIISDIKLACQSFFEIYSDSSYNDDHISSSNIYIQPETRLSIDMLPGYFVEEINQYISIDSKTASMFIPSLSAAAGFAIMDTLPNEKLADGIKNLFKEIGIIEISHWQEFNKKNKGKINLKKFLSSEKITITEFRKIRFDSHRKNIPRMCNPKTFANIYNVTTNVQARLIDLFEDTLFIMQVLERILNAEFNDRGTPILPYLESTLNKVIFKKIIPHNDGILKVTEKLGGAKTMDEFLEVLEDVSKKWEDL